MLEKLSENLKNYCDCKNINILHLKATNHPVVISHFRICLSNIDELSITSEFERPISVLS